ncbi:hypothetical protein [Shewanella sp.]|uniref:hypothetical protein n=1 Tax=Shewanella sp. TaxID=50422 RepID=UPI001ED41B93|nr:hypothetical protein [Shewanella sp.]NRB25631.1 hypothetical protein [Shewanella sp.]
MKHYQISKHSGQEDDTWSSITDIGTDFNGAILTSEEYLRIENLYIETIRTFIYHNSKSFKIKFLMDLRGEDDADKWIFDIDQPLIKVRGGEYLDESSILPLCKLCLRDLMGIRLQADNGDYITFGCDLYLRLGMSGENDFCLSGLSRQGLFINVMNNDPDA